MTALTDIKKALRAGPYAWPGGYPVYFIAADSEALSFESVRANWKQVARAALQYTKTPDVDRDWLITGIAINWEDADLYCVHSNERIESAYAED